MKRRSLVKLKIKKEGVFESTYKSYYLDLLNFANSYVMNIDVAEDIVHDVFSKLWESKTSTSEISNIKSYLFTVVKNSCLNYFKRRDVEQNNQSKVIEAILFSETYTFLEDLSNEKELIRYIELLPEKQREVIKLKYFEEMKYSDISRELDISKETVQTHLKRAFKNLKSNFPTLSNKILFFFTICVPHF